MEELADSLFVEESTIRFYGVRLQTRMAVIRLSDRRLLVYSPVFLEPDVRRQLDALGDVAWVVAPNKIHNQALSEYQRAYPEADFYAPPGLAERRPDLRFCAVLGEKPEPAWEGELDQALTGGNVFFSELLFLHRRSRTLLVADFVENIGPGAASPAARALGRLFGVQARPSPSPEFRLYTHVEEEARASLAAARGWDFERIFLCHGGLIEADAPAVFDAVCEELLAAVRGRSALSRWLMARLAAWQ